MDERLDVLRASYQRSNQHHDESEEKEYAVLTNKKYEFQRHREYSDSELSNDSIMRTARLNGQRKRRKAKMERASAKKRSKMDHEPTDGGVPKTLDMEAVLDTDDKQNTAGGRPGTGPRRRSRASRARLDLQGTEAP